MEFANHHDDNCAGDKISVPTLLKITLYTYIHIHRLRKNEKSFSNASKEMGTNVQSGKKGWNTFQVPWLPKKKPKIEQDLIFQFKWYCKILSKKHTGDLQTPLDPFNLAS